VASSSTVPFAVVTTKTAAAGVGDGACDGDGAGDGARVGDGAGVGGLAFGMTVFVGVDVGAEGARVT
jgi:hypothetical protein